MNGEQPKPDDRRRFPVSVAYIAFSALFLLVGLAAFDATEAGSAPLILIAALLAPVGIISAAIEMKKRRGKERLLSGALALLALLIFLGAALPLLWFLLFLSGFFHS